jgi:D-serine deaminase-like pyridoxal phosphate-dependent protein
MTDNTSQLALLPRLLEAGAHPPRIFVKIDTGYHRAGVDPDSPACKPLLSSVLASSREGHCVLHGLYSHASQSYNARNHSEAIRLLAHEFRGLGRAVEHLRQDLPQAHKLVLSVGATPTATTIQHSGLVADSVAQGTDDNAPAKEVSALLADLKSAGFALEVHAGVYPTLDLQQLATHAREESLLTHSDIAITVLAEVASLYPGRGQLGTTEALVTAGSLALGREPVQGGKDYPGWGIVAPWNGYRGYTVPGADFPAVSGGWQVGRISQEHGILTWVGSKEEEIPLQIGQKVRIWPNHACIAGAGFGYYLVVDSRRQGKEDEVIDVWTRARGW